MNSLRDLVSLIITSLLLLVGVHGTPQNLCTVPQSCSGTQQALINSTMYLSACRCDERCHLYDDCCYDAPEQQNETGNQRHGEIGCELFPVVDKNHYVFLVSRCPKSYQDEDIAIKCNNSMIWSLLPYDRYPKILTVEYVLKKLPVSSKYSGILYRNAFCAICNEELNFEFWTIRLESTTPIETNYSTYSSTDLLGVINGSRVTYGPPRGDLASRSCSRNLITDCPRNWNRNVTEEAESVRSECRSYQSYVQVQQILYRNLHCARCNMVSDSDVTCIDLTEKVLKEVSWPDPLPYSVLLDFNSEFSDFWTFPNSPSGKQQPNDVSIDDCSKSINETEVNGTGCRSCNSSETPCSQGSTSYSKNSADTTGALVLAYLTFVGNILSVISLSCLLLAYCCIPSLRNTPGRCLMCLCASLMLAQLLFAAFGNYDNQIPSFDSTQIEESENETETNSLNQLQNETQTNAFDQLENLTGTNAFGQYNETEDVQNKSTMLLDEKRLPVTTLSSTMVSSDQRDVAVTEYNSDSEIVVKREVPIAPTQFTSNDSDESPSMTSPGSQPVRWTFRKDAKSIVCYASSLISHYFYLSYFCWSNTMAFDVWRTFRTLSSSLPSQADLRRRHFVYYSIYSWSVPAVIVTVAAVMDAVKASVRPLYAVRFCWISNPLGILVFLYVPCLLVTVANVLLFILSCVNICFSSMDDVQSRFGGGRGLEGRRRFFLYVRLASVMGITWASGLLASITKSAVLWYVFVISTAFQGVYIGLCFMATNQMRKVIREKIKLNYTSSVMTKSTIK